MLHDVCLEVVRALYAEIGLREMKESAITKDADNLEQKMWAAYQEIGSPYGNEEVDLILFIQEGNLTVKVD